MRENICSAAHVDGRIVDACRLEAGHTGNELGDGRHECDCGFSWVQTTVCEHGETKPHTYHPAGQDACIPSLCHDYAVCPGP